jgi:hypothetical protein
MNVQLQKPDNFNECRLRHRSKRKIQKSRGAMRQPPKFGGRRRAARPKANRDSCKLCSAVPSAKKIALE